MTANQRMDAILQVLNDHHIQAHAQPARPVVDYLPAADIAMSYAAIIGNSVTKGDYLVILQYLHNEHYIERITIESEWNKDFYRICWKGRVQLENGGFHGVHNAMLNNKIISISKEILILFGSWGAIGAACAYAATNPQVYSYRWWGVFGAMLLLSAPTYLLSWLWLKHLPRYRSKKIRRK